MPQHWKTGHWRISGLASHQTHLNLKGWCSTFQQTELTVGRSSWQWPSLISTPTQDAHIVSALCFGGNMRVLLVTSVHANWLCDRPGKAHLGCDFVTCCRTLCSVFLRVYEASSLSMDPRWLITNHSLWWVILVVSPMATTYKYVIHAGGSRDEIGFPIQGWNEWCALMTAVRPKQGNGMLAKSHFELQLFVNQRLSPPDHGKLSYLWTIQD